MQKLLLLFFSCLFFMGLNAQHTEWVNSQPGFSVNGIKGHKGADVTICGSYATGVTYGNYYLPQPVGSQNTLLVKYDSIGNIKWVDTLSRSVSGASVYSTITTDNVNNLYVFGFFKGDLKLGNDTINSLNSHYEAFLVKYDSNGLIKWHIGGSGILSGLGGGINTYPVTGNVLTIDRFGSVILAHSVISSVTIGGTTFAPSSSSTGNFVVFKFSNTGNFSLGNIFTSGSAIPTDVGSDNDGNIYTGCRAYVTNYTFGSQTLNADGQLILKINPSLQPIRGVGLELNRGTPIGLGVGEDGNVVATGVFHDTVDFGNGVTLTSRWSSTQTSPYNNESFTVYYDSTLTAKWAIKGYTVGTSSAVGGVGFGAGITPIKNDQFYFWGVLYRGKLRLGSSEVSFDGTSSPGNRYQFFLVKMDARGNVLWAFDDDTAQTNYFRSVDMDGNGNLYVSGISLGRIKLFNYSKPGNLINYFAAKISDYAIFRGYVSSGPYCAGDTIKVPFTKQGKYNFGNEFIAELSDSAGNFDGGHRELGRLKDTVSGVINGSLPLFNVATTNKYRIRVISTNPVVQSYYKIDTLRLLIFSKDTANAGRDTTICRGQTIRLTTSGGSKWLWSPSNFITNKDSTNRHVWVQPDSTTEFRIIISDSSGCGVTDTDYVKINVRQLVKANITGESEVCKGYGQLLKAKATGGDSTKYWYVWKEAGKKDTLSKNETLFVRPTFVTRYMLIAGDNCSNRPDTTYFVVKIFTNLKAHPSPDTTICKGKTATLSVIGTGCNPDKYTYEWTEKGSSTVLSTNDSLTVTPSTTTQYQVILKDTSTLLIDTATITVTVDSIFNISTIPDSTICLGQTIDLSANVFSCDTSNMVYTWDDGLGTGKTKTISPIATTTYTVIGENTFNNLKDTAQVTITVRDPLSLTLNSDSTICIGEQAELRAIATGGNPNTYNIQWTANNQPLSTNNQIQVNPTNTTTYTAILSDGCTVENDSAEITITVRPKLEVTVNPDTTICIGEQAELRATAQGGLESNHNIIWSEVGGQWSVATPTAKIQPTTTTTYKARLTDNCTTPSDSAEITITVRPPLTLTINPDSTICVGEQAELRATITGGYTPQHQIQWTANNNLITNNPITKVAPNTTTIYKAILTDNCTTPSDSNKITITVRPPLQLTTQAKDSICSNETLLLTSTPSGGLTNNHQILWTVDGGLWTSNQNPATDTPQQTTTYIATLTDNCSPPIQDTLQVIVLPIPIADFTVSPTFGCPPLTITLQDNSTNNDTTQNTWTIAGTEYQGTQTQPHELLKQGTYSIKLNVKNKLSCSDEVTQQNSITVFEKPQADFIIKPDIKEAEEPLQLYNLSRNFTQAIWQMGDGNQLTTPQDTSYKYHEDDTGNRQVQLIAINNQGCRDTSKQNIHIYNKVHCTIPTAFTPNGDGLNNTFKPVCVGVANYTLTMYNRWGQVIYQQQNGAWDGNYIDQPVPMGVYMYKIQINAQSQKKKLTYGTVQLIR